MEASKLWRCPYLNSRIGALEVGTVASGVAFDAISRDSDAELGNLEIGTQTENNHPNITSLRQSQEVVSESVESLNEDNVEKKEPKTGQQRRGKCFYYDTPFMEDTGVWIPVSFPPMLESDQKEHDRGLYANGGYFPEDDMGLGNCIEEEKELTMWDVIAEMLLVARGKVSAMASADSYACWISWMSDYLLEEAWKEMAQTLTDASFGKVNEILEAEPPRLLADSAASACMLCGVRFHPIMHSRHHCRFCGGIFCGQCSKGRSLLPVKFRLADPQRVCDVCCVRIESVLQYLTPHNCQLMT